ncbi:MAG: SPOR domain-containing protein [Candidatus Acidiferrales bacterium]
MAGAKKGGSGDMVLESRHLVGLFLLLAVIFGIVFTLGYLLGRSQYDTQLRAAAAHGQDVSDGPVNHAPPPGKAPATPPASDWSFYHSGDPKPANDHLVPAPAPAKPQKPVNSTPASQPKAPAASAPQPKTTPSIPKGAIVLQVAALLKESDAISLAQALQEKKFPAFVLSPGPDKYYRVQVGPYADAQSAAAARTQLESQGFKSIVKR